MPLPLIANIDRIYFPEGGQPVVNYSLVDLSPTPVLVPYKDRNPLGDFLRIQSENGWVPGNYVPEGSLFSFLGKERVGDDPQFLPEVNEVTVAYIFAKLATLDSKLIFQPEYYKETLGGYCFNGFDPDLDSATLNFRNLILSKRKFNITLAAVIKGSRYINNKQVSCIRFHPVKFVKFGQLAFNTLDVRVDDVNRDFLQELGCDVSGEVAELNLRRYPVFGNLGIDVTSKHFYLLLKEIRNFKLQIKAYEYALTELKDSMRKYNLLSGDEWYNGELVDEEYVSDYGTEYLSVWIEGQGTEPSLNYLLDSFGEFGDNLKSLFNTISTIVDYDPQDFMPVLIKCGDTVKSLLAKKKITLDEAIVIMSLLDAHSKGGDFRKRQEYIGGQVKSLSLDLSLLELKFATLRWNVFHQKKSPYMMGSFVQNKEDKVVISCPLGRVVMKHGRVEYAPVIEAHIDERDGEMYE